MEGDDFVSARGRRDLCLFFLREGGKERKRMEELRKAHSRLGVHFSSSDQEVA